jgi:hypothetical protein
MKIAAWMPGSLASSEQSSEVASCGLRAAKRGTLMGADRRKASTEETRHRVGLYLLLIVTVLFPVMLVLLWNLGFHWIITGVVVVFFCLLAYGCLAL